jgi:dUTP pyrophosphatase
VQTLKIIWKEVKELTEPMKQENTKVNNEINTEINTLVKLKLKDNSIPVPTYASSGAAAFDIRAVIDDPQFNYRFVTRDQPVIFDTGLFFEIPAGYCMKIYSRSGHGFNSDVHLTNCVGVIDSDYRGELKIKLTADKGSFKVVHGDRIAQGMLEKVIKADFVLESELSSTERGEGGFGSTGVK